MQYHEVKLNISFEGTTIMDDAGIDTSVSPDIKMYVDYIYLDTDERRRFAQTSHEYLITQVQHTGDETALLSSSTQNLRLNLNHPCRYLTWVFANPSKHGHFAGNAATRNTDSEYLAPLKKAKLQLNGHDRASERTGSYFNYTQPWQTLRARPKAGVYLYSFALKPDEHQPSGTCNMSRIDNATLVLQYKKQGNVAATSNVANLVSVTADEESVVGETKDLTALRLFAENYNVLREHMMRGKAARRDYLGTSRALRLGAQHMRQQLVVCFYARRKTTCCGDTLRALPTKGRLETAAWPGVEPGYGKNGQGLGNPHGDFLQLPGAMEGRQRLNGSRWTFTVRLRYSPARVESRGSNRSCRAWEALRTATDCTVFLHSISAICFTVLESVPRS